MKLQICLIGALLTTAFAAPTDPKKKSNIQDLLERIKKAKDPKTYMEINKIIIALGYAKNAVQQLKGMKTNMRGADTSQLDAVIAIYESPAFNDMETMLATFRDIGLTAFVEGASYDEEKLTVLARRLANAIHLDQLIILPVFSEYMKFKNTWLLQEIVLQNPLKESGNNFLEILKEKIPSLYTEANKFRTVYRQIKNAIQNYEKIPPLTKSLAETEATLDFRTRFSLRETFRILSSEENAVEIFNDYGILADTFKSASSYESLQAMYNGLARSKRLESCAILVKETGKCFLAEMTGEEQAEGLEYTKNILELLKVGTADGQNKSKLEEMADDFAANYEPRIKEFWKKIMKWYETTEGRKRFCSCLVTDEDRKIFKEAVENTNPVFDDNDLGAIREKSEKVYALVNLVNGLVKIVRRRGGFGPEVDAFFKELVTTPNSLLRIAEFLHPSQETLDAIVARKKVVIQKFNAMPDEAKKEFVKEFPFRTVINLVLLD